jgi:hypothetical protein
MIKSLSTDDITFELNVIDIKANKQDDSYNQHMRISEKSIILLKLDGGCLINTSDEDKTTDEEEKAHSITAIWNFEKQNYYLKNEKH